MDVTVLLFGPAAAVLGRDRAVVRLAGESGTCGDVLRMLGVQHDALRPFAMAGAGRLAVNRRFGAPEHVIRTGDEVALISMVSGG